MAKPQSPETDDPMVFADPHDDVGSNPCDARPIGDIVAARLSRRAMMRGALAAGAVVAGGGAAALIPSAARANGSTLAFKEVKAAPSQTHAVAEGYDAAVLLRWGDPVVAGAPGFDAANLTAGGQERQFGYNNDFVAFMPLPLGSDASDRGLLCVNHEYTNTDFMWSGVRRKNAMDTMTAERVAVELAAHGHSVVEIVRSDAGWAAVADSKYNRRITMTMPIAISGPAAGHARLKTSVDPTGKQVLGTLNNCSGGTTPWGTVLTAEENFHQYFSGKPRGAEAANHTRYGIRGKPTYGWWAKYVDRFDLAKEPNEPNRFGWVVEIDPYDPASTPVKRTALGRAKHENASTVLNGDGRVVVYSGDDERFDYIYKFVTAGRYVPDDRAANRDLLDDGTLYVARFSDDGRLDWLPLEFGRGPLVPINGFASQADVLIETRRAAGLLGASPMDRPEDVDIDPFTGTVYAMLTNNSRRKAKGAGDARTEVDAANPRAANHAGHVLAMIPPMRDGKPDHAAAAFTWDIPILCGNGEDGARYGEGTTSDGVFMAPDNCTFDNRGRLWITTDQGRAWGKLTRAPDGVFAMDVQGAGAYVPRRFFSVPIGAEMCGPCFTPDGTTLFVAVQHPATDGVKGSNFDTPATRWPDFKDGVPPRPSVVAITKQDRGAIGS